MVVKKKPGHLVMFGLGIVVVVILLTARMK